MCVTPLKAANDDNISERHDFPSVVLVKKGNLLPPHCLGGAAGSGAPVQEYDGGGTGS